LAGLINWKPVEFKFGFFQFAGKIKEPSVASADGSFIERNISLGVLVPVQNVFFQSLVFVLGDEIVFQKVGDLG